MNDIEFKNVEDTLFIPLAARVLASTKYPKYFYDAKSLELANLENVKKINDKSSEYTMLASVARYYAMDKVVKSFLEKNEDGIIINLGSGLETMNYRLENFGGHYYQIDFPEVIRLREKLLGKQDNETFIESDINNFDWVTQVDFDKPVLLVAAGVFQYFKDIEVSNFIENVKDNFNEAEMLFDATDEYGIKYAQKYVKKTGNDSAMMYFYINDPIEFCLKENVELLLERGFFEEARRQLKGLKLYTKIAMKVVEDKKRVKLLQIKCKQ